MSNVFALKNITTFKIVANSCQCLHLMLSHPNPKQHSNPNSLIPLCSCLHDTEHEREREREHAHSHEISSKTNPRNKPKKSHPTDKRGTFLAQKKNMWNFLHNIKTVTEICVEINKSRMYNLLWVLESMQIIADHNLQ